MSKRSVIFVLCVFMQGVFPGKREVIPLIKSVELDEDKRSMDVIAHTEFSKKYLRRDFFVAYDDVDLTKLDYTILTVPFIMNVISAVWLSGDTYSIEAMDEELFYSIKRLKEVFKIMYPKTCWDGELIPGKLIQNTMVSSGNNQIGMLFSNGLDSVFSSLFHRHKKQLLITGWGQVDIPMKKRKLWKKRKGEMLAFGKRYGHDNTFLRSNFSDFRNHAVLESLSPEIYEWRGQAVEDIGWSGLVIPLLFTKGLSHLYIASSNTWDYAFPFAANPFIDGNIKVAGISVVHDAFGYSRQDKVVSLSKIRKELNLDTLYVKACAEAVDANCGRCNKCLQTALGILAIGDDPRDYGFNGSVENILNRAKSLELANLSYITRWRLKKIKECVERSGNPSIMQQFQWLLQLDLAKNITDTRRARNQVIIDWKKLSELSPEIEVPAEMCGPRNIWGEPLKKSTE